MPKRKILRKHADRPVDSHGCRAAARAVTICLALNAVRFFHADVPEVDNFDAATMTARVRGHGYQAW